MDGTILINRPETGKRTVPDNQNAEFNRFVEENYREIFGTAYRLSGSADDAADLTQETFKNVLGAMTGGARPEHARAYLLTDRKSVV
jgi:DNA-directed RNA polymerase specialized sigma24 family protein